MDSDSVNRADIMPPFPPDNLRVTVTFSKKDQNFLELAWEGIGLARETKRMAGIGLMEGFIKIKKQN